MIFTALPFLRLIYGFFLHEEEISVRLFVTVANE